MLISKVIAVICVIIRNDLNMVRFGMNPEEPFTMLLTPICRLLFIRHSYVQLNIIVPKSLLNIRMMMHNAFKIAYLNDLVPKNYIEYIVLPKVIKKEMRVLTKAEQEKLLRQHRTIAKW